MQKNANQGSLFRSNGIYKNKRDTLKQGISFFEF